MRDGGVRGFMKKFTTKALEEELSAKLMLHFGKTAEDADGNTEWTLDVAAYTPKHPHMKIER